MEIKNYLLIGAILTLSFFTAAEPTARAMRHLPDNVIAGDSFNVVIEIDVDDSDRPAGCPIAEAVNHDGWVITSWSEEHLLDAIWINNTAILWSISDLQNGNLTMEDLNFTYSVSVPSFAASGNYLIKGLVVCYYNETYQTPMENTTGDKYITVMSSTTTTTTTTTTTINYVSDFELLNYIRGWVDGLITDFELLSYIDLWVDN